MERTVVVERGRGDWWRLGVERGIGDGGKRKGEESGGGKREEGGGKRGEKRERG